MAKTAAQQALKEIELKEEQISAIPKEEKEEPEQEEKEEAPLTLGEILLQSQNTIEDELQDVPLTKVEDDNSFVYNQDKTEYQSEGPQIDGYTSQQKQRNDYVQRSATDIARDAQPQMSTRVTTLAEKSGYHGRLL